MCIC
jgi:hypothetical protein